mmetsp:Transcript_28958/g.61670  ORF Transcript_28958/g.61670 Transcript_28958/m.61670 type:complete len:376 (-) Transcript_28958:88-1215(-)
MRTSETQPLLAGFRSSKQDPFIKGGNKRVDKEAKRPRPNEEGDKHHVVMRAFALTSAPFVCFNVTLVLLTRMYHYRQILTVVLTFIFIVAVALLPQIMKAQTQRLLKSWHEKWKDYLSIFCLVAAFLGMVAGFVLYYRYLLYYHRYMDMKVYSNVAASSDPMLVADAGIVGFSTDSSLDFSQAVGYYSAELGMMLCVAPVIDTSMSSSDSISFFAAGTDCCGWRGHFHCDDSLDDKASSGLLYIPPQQLVVPAMEWTVKDDEMMEEYKRAVKLHGAVYNTKADPNVRFLHWAKNPRQTRNDIRTTATLHAIVYEVIFLGVCFIAAVLVAMGPKRLRETFLNATENSAIRRPLAQFRRGSQQPEDAPLPSGASLGV